jgi:two-component system phosphate regulon response regulator PhoB
VATRRAPPPLEGQPRTIRDAATGGVREEQLAHRVLIAGSESDQSALVAYHLAKAGLRVITAASGREAIEMGREERPALFVLDATSRGLSAYDVLAELRGSAETKDVGILLLTSRTREADRIKGLALGADDCMARPFAPRELVLRVQAILRRVGGPTGGGRLSAGPVVLDVAAHRVLVEGAEIKVTATEFDLLRALMEREGRVQTRAQLLETVWGTSANVATRTVDMHMQRVRRKLGGAGSCIETVRGTGYRLVRPGVSPSPLLPGPSRVLPGRSSGA